MKASSVLVILPIHNEAAHLERVLASLQPVVRREGYDLVAIDDGSTDASPDILRQSGVPAIRLFENVGYGTAVQTGYKHALAKGYERLLQLDGDGQHDPRFLPALARQLDHCDFVIGSRFLPMPPQPFAPAGHLYDGTRARRAGIRLFRLLLRAMTGRRITDPTSGYLGLNRSCMGFLSNDDYPYDFPDADVVFSLIRGGFRLAETPVYMYHNTVGGQLHRGLTPLWYMFKVTLSLLIAGLRKGKKGGTP